MARRRTEIELRRFKARVGFINAEVYELDDEAGEGDAPNPTMAN